MPADTTTPILGLLLQGAGNNPNAWGDNLNNSVITPLENAIKGVLEITGLTGGALDLTDDSAHTYQTIILSGTLSSDLTITAPATANKWTFINALTTAGFYVLLKTAGNTAVNIPHGRVLDVICDGVDMWRSDREKVGEYFYHGGASAPAGALECDGATPLRASAVDLFLAIGTTHGVGNGATTFTLPDGYTAGKFLRSRTASVAAGTVQTNQNKAHTHTGSGTTATNSVGHTHTVSGTTGNMSANSTHTHTINGQGSLIVSGAGSGVGGGGAFGVAGSNQLSNTSTSTEHTHTFSATSGTNSADHTHTYSFTTSSDGGTEARPENISGIMCIRY